jgi:hypothetical protein
MTEKLFETALGVSPPWYVAGVEFDGAPRSLRIQIDFTPGSQLAVAGVEGVHKWPSKDMIGQQAVTQKRDFFRSQ